MFIVIQEVDVTDNPYQLEECVAQKDAVEKIRYEEIHGLPFFAKRAVVEKKTFFSFPAHQRLLKRFEESLRGRETCSGILTAFARVA